MINEQNEEVREGNGCLEGMDPFTGNCIRIPKDLKEKKLESKQQHTNRKQFLDVNLLEKGESIRSNKSSGSSQSSSREGGGGNKQQNTWSNRLVHTLSNRNRSETGGGGGGGGDTSYGGSIIGDDDEWEDEGANNCIFGHQ
uniref:Uncharacterized protein n=1 Tax=Meloidogyne floridensis TaxID=298350 RepID=A0A915P6X8_9BILA